MIYASCYHHSSISKCILSSHFNMMSKAPKVLAMLVSMIVGKATIITLLSRAFGVPSANAIQTGLLNSQGYNHFKDMYFV